ncbi:MAG: OmpA family protein [Desulfobacterales bacterium]|nr:OmpA family protein [Desulfobacterales bacterium]
MSEKDNENDYSMPEEPPEEQSPFPIWIISYADMVTLLFAFFVMMFAISSTQQESFKKMLQSVKSALGVHKVPEQGTPDIPLPTEIPSEQTEFSDQIYKKARMELEKIAGQVQEIIALNQLEGKVRIVADEGGITIMISDLVLFPIGEAKMVKQGKEIMKKVYKILSQFRYPAMIIGHTDNTPISNEKFESNWELSAARACEVVRFLISMGMNPKLLAAIGYGEFQPVTSNSTGEGRSQNRRVEIKYQRQKVAETIAR